MNAVQNKDDKMGNPIHAESLDTLFRSARTYRAWLNTSITDEMPGAIWDLAKLGPTSGNSVPQRFVFVKSAAAKEKLKPCLEPGNVDKTMAAPVCVIIAHDARFFELMNTFSQRTAKTFADLAAAPNGEAFVNTHNLRNGSLGGAYLMLAARALGLDCGPMSGFDNAKVDAAFFAGTSWKSNFLCNLGHGDPAKLHPRGGRPSFEEVCRIE
jgi:3-hydroxypropanoate dehydrogenase